MAAEYTRLVRDYEPHRRRMEPRHGARLGAAGGERPPGTRDTHDEDTMPTPEAAGPGLRRRDLRHGPRGLPVGLAGLPGPHPPRRGRPRRRSWPPASCGCGPSSSTAGSSPSWSSLILEGIPEATIRAEFQTACRQRILEKYGVTPRELAHRFDTVRDRVIARSLDAWLADQALYPGDGGPPADLPGGRRHPVRDHHQGGPLRPHPARDERGQPSPRPGLGQGAGAAEARAPARPLPRPRPPLPGHLVRGGPAQDPAGGPGRGGPRRGRALPGHVGVRPARRRGGGPSRDTRIVPIGLEQFAREFAAWTK